MAYSFIFSVSDSKAKCKISTSLGQINVEILTFCVERCLTYLIALDLVWVYLRNSLYN